MSGITLERMQDGLRNGELRFHYQPQVSLFTGEINAVEALIRWQTAEGGMVMPHHFLPLAEESGFISEITATLFERLIADANLLYSLHPKLRVSFNLSAAELADPALGAELAIQLRQQAHCPRQLGVEVREDLLDDHAEAPLLARLRELGLSLSVDGCTAPQPLDRLTGGLFSQVKIDRTRINALASNAEVAVIVREMIHSAYRAGLSTVAEGVEDLATYEQLQALGCAAAQGYLVSRPLALADLVDFLADRHRRWPVNPAGMLHLAQIGHLEWKKALVEAAFAFDPQQHERARLWRGQVLDLLRCMVGQWYYSLSQAFAGLAEYRALEAPHHEVHQLAHQLLEEAGRRERDPQVMLQISQRLSSASVELLQGLLALEDRLRSDMLTATLQPA
ncbi:EAL domain-containing protein [Pseudomonas sp. NW5]|uniref:EAL domain-containing protein n=1 Tax=Pseudomonas sp. NW5 TaxID=2934934 RepID=UPI00201FE235|nr:EAL domain-containing protein [Pseudomonas sp. NW5]MCL7461160.1 EAL domain-containing protein [Pseudomonas sp. NW5]